MSRSQTRRRAPAEKRIRAMFDDIVDRYDVVNGVLSLGLDRSWRRRAARAVGAVAGDLVLDLGCGTGELAAEMRGATVVGVDTSHAMLRSARRRAGGPSFCVQGSAFRLPFADGAFAGAASGFVLRNLDDLATAFAELARVVRPGGEVALVDITEPSNAVMRRLFDLYFSVAAPLVGAIVGKADAYRYLARSLAQLPPPPDVVAMLATAGFERCRATALTGGTVTLFTGIRRADHRTGSTRAT